MILSRFTRLRSVIVASALWLVIALPGFADGFTSTLSLANKTTAGLDSLAEDEWAALDKLVAEDLLYARREKLSALDGTFTGRRDEAARKRAGLDKLTAEQLARLNELVAAAIANRPAPKERPRLKEADVLAAKRRGEIHGSVTVAYGWGSGGREFRAGSLWLDYYDPENRFSLGVGISSIEGDGYPGYYPGYYPRGYYDDGFYSSPFFYPGNIYDTDFRGGFSQDDIASFRPVSGGGFGGRVSGRRR